MSRNKLISTLKFTATAIALSVSANSFAVTVINYTHFQPGTSDQPAQAAALAFKDYVEKATNGDVQVKIYPASQLGNGVEVMEGLKMGTIQMAVVHDGAVAPIYKQFQVFSIPYLFEDQKMAWSVLDGPYGQKMANDMLKKTGIKMLAMADNGIRQFTNSKRPISSPEDMKGLKIRVQPGPIFQKLVESLGASPSVITWPELPGALQQGVVDGQENGVTNILAGSLYQYQKYATLDGHIYSLHAYLMNNRFFEKLDADEQKAVLDGVEIAKKIHREMTSNQDLNAKQILTDKGMQVTELTPEQIEAFRQAAQPPVKAWAEQELGKDWVDGVFSAIKDYQEGH
ncbi:C4-dicarboxylate ABC transporter substrate-binding protein [Pokkaliibacter plantistimulans]|uniref:C4-dicarboxylate ABC transporter substrate-binding protein n=1 Tax=Proteobacteria bacterium 228 TaxID=2083153 RepID=A0A2S5KHT2_9PROT|nr:DctP family TRAP transporter solute-binding subunit [Pokkaliibacter plantistimulans]PPC74059.1 C4-dicarboxylate ABC transporter substrate-binding protein [Pokkaliibacter plantistimulans]